MTFVGFPARTEVTPLPEAFFSEVLPGVEDLNELKVMLVAIRRIRKKKGAVRWVTDVELNAAREIGVIDLRVGEPRAAAIDRALTRATACGVLLSVPLLDENGLTAQTAYFVNDPEGRRAIGLVRAGAISLGLPPAPTTEAVISPLPTIFQLYEETIGPIPGAGLADELKDAERDYPLDWIKQAFQEAAANNVRRWSYVRAVLARWRDEGRDNGTARRRSPQARYRTGKYGGVVQWK